MIDAPANRAMAPPRRGAGRPYLHRAAAEEARMPEVKTVTPPPRRSGTHHEMGGDGVLRPVETAAEPLPRRVLRSDPPPAPAPVPVDPVGRVKKG